MQKSRFSHNEAHIREEDYEPHRMKTDEVEFAPSEDSGELGHPSVLTKVYVVYMKKA